MSNQLKTTFGRGEVLDRSLMGGFTLIELVVTVAVAAILLTVAIPSYRSLIRTNCSTSAGNGLLSILTLARSEAQRRNQMVTVCPSSNGTSCTGGNWSTGILSFVDFNASGALDDSRDTVFKVAIPLSACAAVNPPSSFTSRLSFDGTGRVSAQGTFDIVPNAQAVVFRRLVVSNPSKLRICDPTKDTSNCS